eukprot:scaffold1388_cov390-Prasinococcus_capsulatus_cf.AAC.15
MERSRRLSLQMASGVTGFPETGTNIYGAPARPLPPHVDSSQVANLFNPVRGIRDAMLRKVELDCQRATFRARGWAARYDISQFETQGQTPVDHHRHNKIAVREQSSKNNMQKQVDILESGGLSRKFTSGKYQHIQSRLYESLGSKGHAKQFPIAVR